TTTLDVREFIRRFLPHVLPDGCVKVRHFGLLHASCAISPDTLRLLIVQAHPSDCQPTQSHPPQPLAACCPTCGVPRRVVMRLWTAQRALVDTSSAGERGQDDPWCGTDGTNKSPRASAARHSVARGRSLQDQNP